MGVGFSYLDKPEVREIINNLAKKYGLALTQAELEAQRSAKGERPLEIVEETEKILSKNPGAIGVIPGTNIPIFGSTKRPVVTNSGEKKEWMPQRNYVVVGKEVLEKIRSSVGGNNRTHFSLGEVTDGEMHIPGPFAMRYKELLGSGQNSSSGIVGYQRQGVARVLEKWLGKEGEQFRKEHPYVPKVLTREQEEQEKNVKWLSLREIATEFEIPFKEVLQFKDKFGEEKKRDAPFGKTEAVYNQDFVGGVLDELTKQGKIHPEETDSEEDEDGDEEDGPDANEAE